MRRMHVYMVFVSVGSFHLYCKFKAVYNPRVVRTIFTCFILSQPRVGNMYTERCTS